MQSKKLTVWIQIRPHSNVGPDLGPNCLSRLSANDTSRQRNNFFFYSLLQEERQKRLGPGGLDPVEVFESLPEVRFHSSLIYLIHVLPVHRFR